MKRVLAVFIVLALSPLCRAEEKPANPFKNAKVGDWVEYKLAMGLGDNKVDGTTRITVSARTDKEVTLKTVVTVLGMENAAPESKIDLTKPFDPFQLTKVSDDADVKVEKTGEGKEKVKIADKEYDTKWIKTTVKGKAPPIDGVAKVWVAEGAPLGGVVKMEMTTKVAAMEINMTMELARSGSK